MDANYFKTMQLWQELVVFSTMLKLLSREHNSYKQQEQSETANSLCTTYISTGVENVINCKHM